ncbi:MAG: hypothetical protein GYA02_09175 [Clostridiaceae bacterium]|nr:hypothetical protein [Clostridiaceae bacterium]
MKVWTDLQGNICNIFFILNSILIFLATVFASYQIAMVFMSRDINKDIQNLNDKYKEKRMMRDIRRYMNSSSSLFRVNLIEKIEINLIEKSNIKSYIPFANFYLLSTCSLAIFIVSFQVIYKITLFIPSAIILCSLAALAPIFILDIMAKYNSEKVRKKLAGFISVLNRWCTVKEDIFYAFEKSIESGIGEPLRTYIRDMIIQVNRGVEPLEAISMLEMKVDNPQFRDFIVNIKQNVKHRGEIRKLLSNLEEQFYKIEEEYNRRKISTYKDRLIIYFIMVLVLIVGYTFLRINPQVEQFYLTTHVGKLLLMIFCVLYALGFYLTVGIARFDV